MTIAEMLEQNPSNQRPLVAGIVTYSQYDMATRAAEAILTGTRKPDRLLIVDNGRAYRSPFGDAVEVIRPPFNLGYSGGINHACDLAGEDVDCLLFNDDMIASKHTVEMAGETPGWFISLNGFGCFLMRPRVRHIVGPWEAAYWPMGPEDQDYNWRMHLALPEKQDAEIMPGAWLNWGGIVVRGDPALEHVGGGKNTWDTIGAWAMPLKDRASELLYRRWGLRVGPQYIFTYEQPYNGDQIDEIEVFVNEGIRNGALPSDVEPIMSGHRRIAQFPGISPYWSAAAVLWSPDAELVVCRPLSDAWPAVWGVAQERLHLTLIEGPDALTEPVDLLLVEQPQYAHWTPMARAVKWTRGT